jgi:D-3-phosphoglycerate dehydrogenase
LLDSVVVTPHLGASTVEAQDKAGDTIADMVELALAGEFVPFAVNVSAGEVSETVRPYQSLSERLGAMLAGLAGGEQKSIEISYDGQIAEYDTRILTLSVLKGYFGVVSGDPVSYVNAPQMATEHGIDVRPSQSTTPKDYVNLVTVRCGEHAVAGTLAGLRGVAKIVMIDDFTVDIRPAEHMLVVRNDDVPGMIGTIGMAVGEAGVNIADMVVGQDEDGVSALMVLATDQAVPDEVVAAIAAKPAVRSVTRARG